MSNKQVRHILGLSGGKDSTALAILMHKQVPQMEYSSATPTRELPETYEYLDRIKARLGIKLNISVLIADLTTGWMSMVDSCPRPRCAGVPSRLFPWNSL